jgi:hypothetical protein
MHEPTGGRLVRLTEALLCTDGPVKTLVGLSLAPEHRRGHGALYDALNHSRIEVESLRLQPAGTPSPRAADGRPVLAVDVPVAASGRQLRPAALVLPHLRPRQGRTPHDPGLAVLDRRRPADLQDLRRTG